ncbi:MAG: hypothetical protein QOG68_1164, partial [Solirubrobacteraceae bacterium]|nr:hypothetical protein [Solirubrobacteraceae bacterium]
AFLAPAAGLKTVAQLDRQGTITNGPDDGDDTAGCPSGGGESPPPAPDCGPSTLPLSVVFAPAEKPALTVTPPPETTTYLNCPVAGTVLPATPNGLVSAPLVSGIGPAPGPGTVAISLRGTDVISDADSDATSTLAVDLRLDRIAVVEALDLADTFHDAHVDDRGITRLPVRCPAGSTCSGRIGIAAGSDGASASRAAKQPRWPRPLLTPEPLVGSARFSIKGGRSARIPVRIAHGSAVALQGLAFETLDVIVRQRAGNASKPVAFVAGQVRIRVG